VEETNMAKRCPNCHQPVPLGAKECPSCRAEIPQRMGNFGVYLLLFLCLAGGVALFFQGGADYYAYGLWGLAALVFTIAFCM